MENLLREIKEFADMAHGEQLRKYAADRYIVHPVRVMERCREFTDDPAICAAALLHDVLEDTPVMPDEILGFLKERMPAAQAEDTLNLVEELTDVYISKDFPEMNRRLRKEKEAERLAGISARAQTIKYADILDNCREIVDHDKHFARIFLIECYELLQRMKKGDASLRLEALEVVEAGIRRLGIRKNKIRP